MSGILIYRGGLSLGHCNTLQYNSIFREYNSIFREYNSIFREYNSIFREYNSIFREYNCIIKYCFLSTYPI